MKGYLKSRGSSVWELIVVGPISSKVNLSLQLKDKPRKKIQYH